MMTTKTTKVKNGRVSLPKTTYKELQQIKKRYEAIKQLISVDIFEKPHTRNIKKVMREFRGIGLYNEDFLKSLGTGLKKSSYFSRPRS